MEAQALSPFTEPRVGMRIFVKGKDVRHLSDAPIVHGDIRDVTLDHFAQAKGHGTFLNRNVDILTITAVGEGDQAGFIKVQLPTTGKEVWVQTSSLSQTKLWSVDRRNGDSLDGERLDEICNPDAETALRRDDDVRKFTIRAVRKQMGTVLGLEAQQGVA